jgi:hypothetical protein
MNILYFPEISLSPTSLPESCLLNRSRIHEHTISLRVLGTILRVLRLEVSVYNVYITNQFQTLLITGGRGIKSVNRSE